jgi:manganese/zinc/iron transport system substrate-binding protein
LVRLITLCLLLALAAAGCGAAESGSAGAGERPVRAVATTNFVADTVSRIGGRRVAVTGLMGPGVDPHLFKASAGDVSALREADIVFYAGLELEGKMADLFERIGAERPAVALGEAAPEGELLRVPGGAADPHVWFDPQLWGHGARAVAAALEEADPAGRDGYRQRLAAFLQEVRSADRDCREALEAVPEQRRVLVTSHDAFAYFGRRHRFDVLAIQGISTAAEASTADVTRVAEVIAERGIRTIFVESSVPRQTIDAVAAAAERLGQRVEVGPPLFSDAAGDAGTREGTYAGMLRHNCTAVAEGLR